MKTKILYEYKKTDLNGDFLNNQNYIWANTEKKNFWVIFL